mmetsp:Transcript_24778/g.40541  ORF Transcript_24778/g.40541 Transcript_24778/m.40541 type:complete len:253 (-) Transcript_24778:83-841(-)
MLKPTSSDLSLVTFATEENTSDRSGSDTGSVIDATSGSTSSYFTGRRSCLISAPSSRRSTNSLLSASSVSFGSIEIRDYERIAGDHPDTNIGVPLAIGWAFKERGAMPVDKYEKAKMESFLEDHDLDHHHKYHHSHGGTGANLRRLGAMTRKRLLHEEFHIPLDEILQAEKAVQKFKKHLERQRRAEEEGVDVATYLKNNRKKSIVRSLRKGVMNRLSLRQPSSSVTPCKVETFDATNNNDLSQLQPVQVVG